MPEDIVINSQPGIGEAPPPYQATDQLPPYDVAFLSDHTQVVDVQPRLRTERRTGRTMTMSEVEVMMAQHHVRNSLAAFGVTLTGCVGGGITPIVWGYLAAVPCATYVGWPLSAVCCVASSCAGLNSIIAMVHLRDVKKVLIN